MSNKRGMDAQGGEERYGSYGGGGPDDMSGADAPRQATAAQLAKRNIAKMKSRGSARSSRQSSPAVAAPNPFGQPQQAFQPPPSAGGGFNFSFGASPAFGQQPQQPEQNSFGNNNGGGAFGDTQNNTTPSFGSTFNSTSNSNPFNGNSQPQQNGFNPSTSAFGQALSNGATTPGGSAFTFGQSQAEQSTQSTQQNGFNSGSNGFGGSSAQQNGASSNPFGASQPASTPFTFGASQPEQPAKSGTPFQFGASQPAQEAPKPRAPSFGGFGPSQNGSQTTSLFGASASPTPEPSTAAGESVFSSVANKSNGIKAGMFTQSQQNGEQTPKSASAFSFGSQPASGEQTPKAPFSFGQSTNGEQTPKPASNLFSFGQQNETLSQETPKPSSNLFSGASQPTEKAPATGFTFGQSQSAAPDQATPKPSSSLFSGEKPAESTFKFGQSQAAPETPSSSSLFSGLGQQKETPKIDFGIPKQTESQPEKSKSLFEPAPAAAQTPDNSGKSLFDRMEQPATAPRPSFSSDLFGGSGDKTPSNQTKSSFEPPATAPKPTTSMFQPINAKEPSAPSPSLFAPKTTTPTPSAVTPPAATSSKSAASSSTAGSASFKTLNESLLEHLKTSSASADWTAAMKYYIEQAAKIAKDEVSAPAASPQPAPSSNMFGSQTPKAPAPTNMFKAAQTPKPVGSSLRNQIFQSPPNTAPVSRKRSADDELSKQSETAQPPATEKRARPNESVEYPKLPDSASNTARLFQSTLEKSTDSTPKFGPPDDVVAKVREDAAKKSEAAPPKFGFPPAASTSSGSVGFKPTFGASSGGGPNAFSSFAQKAQAAEAKEKQKRKDEDFDSDEDDLAEWEAKDKAAQEEKARQLREAAQKAPGFTFKPSGDKPSSSVFSQPASTSTGSNMFGSKPAETTPSKPASSGLFGQSISEDKSQAEKEQGSGDHTWKPNTPIKFGAPADEGSTTPSAPPPANPFGGLFGSNNMTPAVKNTGSDGSKAIPPTPTIGWKFGLPKDSSVDTSRATTPGLTTDGEASTAGEGDSGEPSEAQNDKQVDDMTALLPEERAENEVLFETKMAKAMKFDEKKTETGMVPAWVERGKGPLYILKNKETGKVRVLIKVPPLGNIAMNFAAMKDMEYAVQGAAGKTVKGTFMDHLEKAASKQGKPSQWTIMVREPKDAAEIAKHLTEGRPE